MALDTESGKRMLQLVTSRYNNREWRKQIEKTLSLSASGVGDEVQRTIFLYLKHGLKAYKSRRADPDSWIVGGYATTEVIERAKFDPTVVGAAITKEDVVSLGVDPGPEVDQAWWEEMLVAWFEEPETEEPAAESEQPAPDDDRKKAEA
ncbi:MAG: hypothetical protein ACREII_03440 [Nitrospiraceae bacterium]